MGSTAELRQKNYQSLFQHSLDKELLKNIRDTTNKSWVLGDAQFKGSVAEQLARRVTPIAKGGDRKSRGCHEMTNINLLWPHWLSNPLSLVARTGCSTAMTLVLTLAVFFFPWLKRANNIRSRYFLGWNTCWPTFIRPKLPNNLKNCFHITSILCY